MLLENNSQEQLIFKHAISTVVSNRTVMHTEHRPVSAINGMGPTLSLPVPNSVPSTLIGEHGDSRRGTPSIGRLKRAGHGGEDGARKPERAVLVGVDLGVRAPRQPRGPGGARQAAVRSNEACPARCSGGCQSSLSQMLRRGQSGSGAFVHGAGRRRISC